MDKEVPATADLAALAEALKALADETRLTILTLLQGGEMCVCEIEEALKLAQPTVSHHLKILRHAGLLTGERQGKWIYYRTRPEALAALSEALQNTIILPAQYGASRPHSHPTCCEKSPAEDRDTENL